MVKGIAGLQARMARVPQLVIEAVEKELDAIGPQLVAEMRNVVPEHLGDLKASIGWERVRKRGTFEVRITRGGNTFARIGIRMFVGRGLGAASDPESYAVYQEFGTKEMDATPFFFPVVRANRARIRARLNRAINRAVAAA